MNREILETYLNIVKTHSFTKTAEHMFISQSAVSNRLASLENELNVKLVERSPGQKGITLTRKGEEFTEFAKQYLELDNQVQDWRNGTTIDVLKVASVISLTDYILKDFYLQLLGKRDMSIVLSTHWTDRIISMLENRETDIGITPRVFYSRTIDALPMFDEPLYLVSNTQVSHYPDVVSMNQLQRSNEIYFDWGLNFVEWHDNQMDPHEPPLIVTDTTGVIEELLRIPDSFSIIPASIFKCFDHSKFKLSRITPEPPHRTCYLLKLKEPQSNKREAILRFETEFRWYIRGVEDIIPRE